MHSEFIMALGDDWTDEHLSLALPAEAYTIEVGVRFTAARNCVEGIAQARELLQEMVQKKIITCLLSLVWLFLCVAPSRSSSK